MALLTPKTKSILSMTFAVAFHFAGYELARSSVLAMITSKRTGFSSPSAVSFATGCVGPFALVLLWLYSSILERNGPRKALRYSALSCAAMMAFGGFVLGELDPYLVVGNNSEQTTSDSSIQIYYHVISKGILWLMFVLQNGFVQLLYTQHWSFLGSVCAQPYTCSSDPEGTSAMRSTNKGPSTDNGNGNSNGNVGDSKGGHIWFAPIAGVGSITSTLAALAVSHLLALQYAGLTGLLYGAALGMLASAGCSEFAYHIAQQHGFEPKKEQSEGRKNQTDDRATTNSASNKGEKGPESSSHATRTAHTNDDGNNIDDDNYRDSSLIQKANRLFQRVPVLRALCVEVLTCQCLSSLINYLFVMQVRQDILDDESRAGWTGKCYAFINGASGILQFCVLPIVAKDITFSRRIWMTIPFVMLGCTFLLSAQITSPLFLISATFFMMKTMEYALRGLASEMLYATLDYESRFVGKEIIGLFANRFGKSGMAVALSALTVAFGSSPELFRCLALASTGFAFLWLLASFRLAKLIGTNSRTQSKTE